MVEQEPRRCNSGNEVVAREAMNGPDRRSSAPRLLDCPLGSAAAPTSLTATATAALDDVPATARRSLAVEPMTANADAFRSGEDLLTLAPAGEPGDEVSVSWGVRAVEEQP